MKVRKKPTKKHLIDRWLAGEEVKVRQLVAKHFDYPANLVETLMTRCSTQVNTLQINHPRIIYHAKMEYTDYKAKPYKTGLHKTSAGFSVSTSFENAVIIAYLNLAKQAGHLP